jgi:hypothetical protein
MSDPQKTYRVYSFDGLNMSLVGDEIEAVSDDQAIAAVSAAGFGTKCEIWEGHRLVAQFDGERGSERAA